MLVELYKSYDGEAAGVSRLAIQDDGAWSIKDLAGRVQSSGKIDPKPIGEYLSYWRDLASRRANGWAEAEFGGCHNPIDMAAVRCGTIEIHYKIGRHAEFNDMEMSNRQLTILSLIKKLQSWIPELARHPVFI